MEITFNKGSQEKIPPTDEATLGFGKVFTNHMFTMHYHHDKGWFDPVIGPYGPLALDPAAQCLHYAQEIFEGMKAYRGDDGSIYLFRPAENAKRMNISARRMCMPEVDESFFVEAVKQLVLTDKEWVPRTKGASLYIRPAMIATEAAIGVQIPKEYLFFIIVGPVGAYYPEGFNPTRIYVSEDFIRAAPGGTGATKAGANYAISLYGMRQANEMGYTQVLWLDAVERRFIEEVGTSNIFFVIDDELITPPLEGTILPGIIRNSVIQLARTWDIKVSERRIDIHEMVKAVQSGALQEVFASGTAAVISPVGHIYYRGAEYEINKGCAGPLARKFYDNLLAIQYGLAADPFQWRVKIA
ncbi:MAG: branched-chain amino acid aminotransferase [Syntrophobacterales bacterium]|jgi:branched-chain amino acid aminotransferase|nr:branched-chain amino acid aminotransferase [Syntrophobacterales bacterium]